MTHPVDSVFVDGVNVSKAAVRSFHKLRSHLSMASVSELRASDLTGQFGLVYVRDIARFFALDSSDSTSSDNGSFILVDAAGNRFKRAVQARETLTAYRIYYVRTDGSDSNNGLSNTAGGAFLTIQKAIDTVATLDLGTSNVYIYVADGTYSGNIVLKPVAGAGKIYLIGNTSSPQNCIISATSGHVLTVQPNTVAFVTGWNIKGFELRNSGGGGTTSVFLTDNANIVFDGPMRLGSNNGTVYGSIYVEMDAKLSLIGQSLIVAASGPAFLFHISGGKVDARNSTISWLQNTTYAGTVYALADGLIALGGTTWTLNGYTITTTYWRYGAITLALIDSNGGGATFIPGSTAGYTANGGIYI